MSNDTYTPEHVVVELNGERLHLVTDAHGGFPLDLHSFQTNDLVARVLPIVAGRDGAEIAERIAVCVNACAGLPTERLASGGPGCLAEHIAVALGEYETLQVQRDELLAAAEFFLAQACGAEDDVCGDWDRHETAISKAKGGAA